MNVHEKMLVDESNEMLRDNWRRFITLFELFCGLFLLALKQNKYRCVPDLSGRQIFRKSS